MLLMGSESSSLSLDETFSVLKRVNVCCYSALDIKSEDERRPKDCIVYKSRWHIPSFFALLRKKDDDATDKA
jgi:hypothetical protein